MRIKLSEISIAKGFNPREKLDRANAQSIALSFRTVGQLDPILARKGDFELIDGKTRIAAAKLIGWKSMECEIKDATDLEARTLALLKNKFGNRLNEFEIGKNVDGILNEIPKQKGREKMKIRLAKELGLQKKTLEDYLATFRMLHPEARKLSSYLIGKGVLKHKHVQEIRQLDHQHQLAVLKQASKAAGTGKTSKDHAPEVDRLVRSYIASVRMGGLPKNDLTLEQPNAKAVLAPIAKVSFQRVYTFDAEDVLVERLTEGSCWFRAKGKLVSLDVVVDALTRDVQVGDVVSVHLARDIPTHREVKVVAVKEIPRS